MDLAGLLARLSCSAEPDFRRRGFTLRLGDGSCWWISGSPQASFLAEKLAAIMQLQETAPEEGRCMYFYEKSANNPQAELDLSPARGWINLYHPYLQAFFHPQQRHIFCEYDAADPNKPPFVIMAYAAHAIHWESICRGGVPFHGALLEHRGQGVVLAAPGGTGKSTCSRRAPSPWQGRCDDEVLVVRDPSGRYLAHPFPTWTDYLWERAPNTWNVADAIPLAGLFFLEKSPEDEVIPLVGAKAAVAASQSAEQLIALQFLRCVTTEATREIRRTLFNNACTLARQIPAFRLRVTLTGKFWEKIEAALGWR